MMIDDLCSEITNALSAEGLEQADRAGLTRYDRLTLEISNKKTVEELDLFFSAFTSMWVEALDEGVEYWIRFTNLLDNIAIMTVRHKSTLVRFYEGDPPNDVSAKCYLLRKLSYLDCPVDWGFVDLKDRDSFFEKCPLIYVDALIWARRLDDAASIMLNARKAGLIDDDHISEMLERCKSRSGEKAYNLLSRALEKRGEDQSNVVGISQGFSNLMKSLEEMTPNYESTSVRVA